MLGKTFWTVLACCAGISAMADDGPTQQEWKVDGVAREAFLYLPAAAKTAPCPLLFAFHGHGGTMKNAAQKMAFQKVWPEAIVVYMQGLNTPGVLVDPEGKLPGWQKTIGDQGDRDLKFYDAVLATLQKDYRVDVKRIYATGHSNGGAFVYVLWAARGEALAAAAPCAAALRQTLQKIPPRPVFVVAGKKDNLVKFAWQERTIDALRKLNGCEEETRWGKCTMYASKNGTPVVTYVHAGGHGLPEDAPALIVKFFKEHAKP